MERADHPHLFPLVREPASRWERTGLSPRQERWSNRILALLVVAFAAGWGYAVADALRRGEAPPRIATRVASTAAGSQPAPDAAFLLDAALDRVARSTDVYRGESGALEVVFQQPGEELALADSVPAGAEIALGSAEAAGDTVLGSGMGAATTPGIWNVILRMRGAVREVPELRVVTLVPGSEKRGGRIGGYLVGSWPWEEGGTPKSPAYAPPRGFIRVTPENRDVQVSEHFRLGQFLTKGQEDVWPKYLVLSPRLLDKLELTVQELQASGTPVENVFVVSGFRTPSYNRSGGDPSGRGELSRHMYGDASDIVVDNDRDGRMDDLNHDGRVNVADARIIAEAAQRVEQKHPELIGGIGIYKPTGGHSGMVHIDARGYRARWGAW